MQVGRTQSAISMQMKRLEELAGPPALFIRRGRAMCLTERAQALLPLAREALASQGRFENALTQQVSQSRLRVGAPEDYIASLLPPVLEQFSKSHPGVEVSLVCAPSEDLFRYLAEGQVDLALVTMRMATDRVDVIRSEPMVWAATPDFKLDRALPLPLAMFQQTCPARISIEQSLRQRGQAYRVACSSPSLSAILAVVRQGMAITALPRCAVPRDLVLLPENTAILPSLPVLTIGTAMPDRQSHSDAALALAADLRHGLSLQDMVA